VDLQLHRHTCAHKRTRAALAPLPVTPSTLLRMLTKLKIWLPALAIYALGAIPPAVVVIMMTR
jgi:hypothetical protein